MRVAVLGTSKVKLTVEMLEKFLPEDITVLICDDLPEGMSEAVIDYAKYKKIRYSQFKLEPFNEQGAPPGLMTNDKMISFAEKVILFGFKDTPYVLYVAYKCKELNKEMQIADLSVYLPKRHYKRDVETVPEKNEEKEENL